MRKSPRPLARRLAWLVVFSLASLGGGGDTGVLLEVDLARYRLEARDLAARVDGPAWQVAVGSPTHPTPRGEFRPSFVVRNPSWTPGPVARSLGGRPLPPSSDGPLGVGKIPLGHGGIQIHGGAHPLELGKPVSLGCVSVVDRHWQELIGWLDERGTLAPWSRRPAGDVVSEFRRPVRVVVR